MIKHFILTLSGEELDTTKLFMTINHFKVG